MILGGGVSSGVILQRFPEKDWPDTPFIEGIEWVQNFFSETNLIISLLYLYVHYLVLYSFVNRKDGLCQQRDKSHASLCRY